MILTQQPYLRRQFHQSLLNNTCTVVWTQAMWTCPCFTFIFLAISVFWWRMYSRMACLSYMYPSGLEITQKHDRRCSVTWQMLVADCFSTALLCEEPTLWQDPDRAEETDSSSRSLWSHLYPVECSVSHNQTQLCRERKRKHGEQCNSTLLQQLTFSRKHLTSNDWVTGTFNMSEIWRKYNTVWFLHDTLNLSYRFQNKYGLY